MIWQVRDFRNEHWWIWAGVGALAGTTLLLNVLTLLFNSVMQRESACLKGFYCVGGQRETPKLPFVREEHKDCWAGLATKLGPALTSTCNKPSMLVQALSSMSLFDLIIVWLSSF